MTDQLTLDFDPTTTAAQTAQQKARDAAFDDLVQTRAVTVAEALDHQLYYQQTPVETVTVRVCPACGTWEPNEWLLANNHGIEREHLVQMDDGEWATRGANYGRLWCVALDLTANHATYADGHLDKSQKAMVAQLRPQVRAMYEHEVATRPRRYPPAPTARKSRGRTSTPSPRA